MNEGRTKRLQGTDGIRARVGKAADYDADPLAVFLEHGLLTEEFFELYCYAYVHDLIEKKEMKPGEEIVIGWDPRDTKNFYTARAMSGIAKAGGLPVVAGTIPTPGVALALVSRKSAGGVMITASHNPKDQNGIKIFLAPHAMKPLPEQDAAITSVIFGLDWDEIKNAPAKYETLNAQKEIKKLFIDFHLDARNSWIAPDSNVFSDVTLIVDPARGALSGLAADYFKSIGFNEVIEVASELDGRVNENSGVAFLEGFRTINAELLQREPGLAGHELVKAMLETGKSNKNKKLIGVAFDADGDRFYILVKSASGDAVHILSGDETAALQGGYLMKTNPERYRKTAFVHTVESDINVSRHAKRLGFTPELTGVGDKWILQKAIEAGTGFGIGLEETGHSIHHGYAITKDGAELPFYAGNGLKGAINTLVSICLPGQKMNDMEFDAFVKTPFEPGFKKSVPAYYVDKTLFARGSVVWNGIKERLYQSFDETTPPGYRMEEAEVGEEEDMLFFKLIHESQGMIGTLFARNSGTEEKASVYVRGPIELKTMLTTICEEGAIDMKKNMMSQNNPMANAEILLLKQLSETKKIDRDALRDINTERLLFEMEIKQKLIKKRGSDYSLTTMGRRLVN